MSSDSTKASDIASYLSQNPGQQVGIDGSMNPRNNRPIAGLIVPDEPFPSPELTLPRRIAGGLRADVANALATSSPMTSMYAATVDFSEATRRLRQARESRQAGIEPGPGEWADAAGAMNKRYQRRQQRLEREVVAAERRSYETSLVHDAFLRPALMGSDATTDPLDRGQP
jgi:hypothetical protein